MELCSFLEMSSSNLSLDVSPDSEVSIRGGLVSFAPALGGVTTRAPALVPGFGVDVWKVLVSVLHDCFVRGSGHSELGEKTATRFDISKGIFTQINSGVS